MKPPDLLRVVAGFLERERIDYFVTGSMITIAYGEARFTNDVDVVVDLRSEHVPAFMRAFPQGEFYVSEPAIREAIRGRRQFNLIHPASGLKVDFMIRSPDDSEFDRSRFQRVGRYEPDPADDFQVNRASLEDVFLKKMVYFAEGGSEKHLRDIASVIAIGQAEIDRAYLEEWAARLGVTEVWEAIRSRLGESRMGESW